MELKVACGCGQKYKFDVEPVNGQMPFNINCPSCGVDGTPVANQLLVEHFTNNPPPPIPAAPPPAPGGLRINRPAPEPTPPPLPTNIPTPPPLPGKSQAAKAMAPAKPLGAPQEFRLGMGILGAFLGSAVGGALMYGFFIWAGFRFPLSGTAIGALAAISARWLARGRDSTLGIITAVFAVSIIVGALFLMYGGFPPLAMVSVGVCGYLAYRLAS